MRISLNNSRENNYFLHTLYFVPNCVIIYDWFEHLIKFKLSQLDAQKVLDATKTW